MNYSVLLMYPSSLSEDTGPNFYLANAIEADNVTSAVERARREAFYAQAPKDRRGLRTHDFKYVMVLANHVKPVIFNGGVS